MTLKKIKWIKKFTKDTRKGCKIEGNELYLKLTKVKEYT